MKKPVTLKRELGLVESLLCGIGIIIGTGVYVLIGQAAGMAGNAVWISFLLASFLAAFTGLSYAELSSLLPKAGAEYVYVRKSMGQPIAFMVGWLILISGVVGASTVALGFAGYFSELFKYPIICAALALIATVSVINFIGIKQSVWFADISTLIEIAGLLIIIAIGLPYIGSINYFETPKISGIFEAAALIFFAFIGFEDVVKLSEETKNPRKTIPKALLLSIAITTIIYISVAVSVISAIDWKTLSASQAPLSLVAAKGGIPVWLFSIIALFATGNTVLLLLVASSRLAYGMAEARTLPMVLARVHPKTRTPWVAIFSLMIFSMLFVLKGDIKTVANLTNFTVFVTFFAINASVIILRYKMKQRRAFKVPLNIGKFPVIPALGMLFCLFMLGNVGLDVLAYGAGFLVAGAIVYKLVGHRGHIRKIHAKRF
ncbi:MAG: APC family permease [Candidatus Aenigmatarchaeota archaeon]